MPNNPFLEPSSEPAARDPTSNPFLAGIASPRSADAPPAHGQNPFLISAPAADPLAITLQALAAIARRGDEGRADADASLASLSTDEILTALGQFATMIRDSLRDDQRDVIRESLQEAHGSIEVVVGVIDLGEALLVEASAERSQRVLTRLASENNGMDLEPIVTELVSAAGRAVRALNISFDWG